LQRYVCVHFHSYQPPRENAWLEVVELQDSAYPFHDWNARITAECYAPNGASRILDGEGRIEQIVNNYARISYNIGPTLLTWLEQESPEVYQTVVDADRESQELFDGNGSAMAQAYNHMILPLANTRDKATQIYWGVEDFRRRFGRDPVGMWMPEAAVDLESLDIMAEYGIKFTVLSPFQAHQVRELGEEEWDDVTGGDVDPTLPYLLSLPSGRTINVFFYDGPISQAVAFEGLLSSGEAFADRLMSGFDDERDWPQILHIATDGESYGHHHRHGEMALSYALHVVEQRDDVELINYAAYLDRHEVTHEAEVYEHSSWSCVHGVERWRANCGCNSGGRPEWDQEWRKPLRESLDWLRDTLAPLYEKHAGKLLKDPWKARDEYIHVIFDRDSTDDFFTEFAKRELDDEERIRALELLEMQRYAMLMYTSCGWFFDELSGIETVQVIQYAGRAVQLAQSLFGDSLEKQFLERLAEAKSNLPEHGDGRNIFNKFVKPAMVGLEDIGAHYAISSLFEDYEEMTDLFAYAADLIDSDRAVAGRASMHTGQVCISSKITGESEHLAFGVVHFGDHNMLGGVRSFRDPDAYETMKAELAEAFDRAEFPELVRLIDKHFESHNYSIRSLFVDEQRKILDVILDSSLAQAAAVYSHVHEDNAPLMHFLTDIGAPLPDAFEMTAEFVVNSRLGSLFSDPDADLNEISTLLEEVGYWNIELDQEKLAYVLSQTIDKIAEQFGEDPDDLETLARLRSLVEIATSLPFEVNLWKSQNVFYGVLQTEYPERAEVGGEDDVDEEHSDWLQQFVELGENLRVKVA
jgi:alpha-amylase/alpha-mannosidase (GH57 family)